VINKSLKSADEGEPMKGTGIRVVHAADFHLGAPFTSLSHEAASIRRAEQEQTFLNVISFCETESTDVLLLAGDIFDAIRISPATERLIRAAFSRISNTRIFISPGNHDPYAGTALYDAISDFSHVRVFEDAIQPYCLNDLDCVVWGAGFRSARQSKSLIPEGFNVSSLSGCSADTVHLMVMHGEVIRGSDAKSQYNPIPESRLAECGANYVALGHVHDATPLQRAGNTFWAYAGCPEPRGFDELGPRGFYHGTINQDSTDLTYRAINRRTYHRLDVDVSGIGIQDDLKHRLMDTIKRECPEKYADDAFRLTMIGRIPGDFSPEMTTLKRYLEKYVFAAKILDDTIADIHPDDVAGETSLRGAFTRHMKKRIVDAELADDDAQMSVAERALSLGLKAFEGEVRYREDS